MKFSKNRILTTGLGVTLAAALVLGGGTYAYLQSTTEDVVNNFKANKVLVSLEEDTGSQYNIIPGTSQDKDPKVTLDATVSSYVYVEVNDATNGLVTYELAEGWTLLDGYDNVYYREAAGSGTAQEFEVLKDNRVSYDAALENSDMLNADGGLKKDFTLSFKAYAIQKDGFADAAAAYIRIGAKIVDSEEELKNALADAAAGAVIELKDSIALEEPLTISKDMTIIGDGNTVISNKPVNIAKDANVTFKEVQFRSPTNNNNNASSVYAYSLEGKLVFDGCTFINPQWDSMQITPKAGAEIVINNCTFKLENPVPEGNKSRFIHIEATVNSNADVKVTITNNHFGANTNMKDDMIGIYYVNIEGIDFGGNNTFENASNEMDDATGGIWICGSSVNKTITGAEAYNRFTGSTNS